MNVGIPDELPQIVVGTEAADLRTGQLEYHGYCPVHLPSVLSFLFPFLGGLAFFPSLFPSPLVLTPSLRFR